MSGRSARMTSKESKKNGISGGDLKIVASWVEQNKIEIEYIDQQNDIYLHSGAVDEETEALHGE